MVLEIVTPMTYKLDTLSSLPYQHLLVTPMLGCTQQGHRNAFVQIREQGKAVGPRFFMTLKSQLRNALATVSLFGCRQVYLGISMRVNMYWAIKYFPAKRGKA